MAVNLNRRTPLQDYGSLVFSHAVSKGVSEANGVSEAKGVSEANGVSEAKGVSEANDRGGPAEGAELSCVE